MFGPVAVVAATVLASFLPSSICVRVGITHWNDVNGQIESFQRGNLSSDGTPIPCPNKAEAVLQCIGGLRSLAHWLNDSTAYGGNVLPENILRLSSGNLVGEESGWISSIDGTWGKFGSLVKTHFRPHVTSLGLKEFGAGLHRTLDYVQSLDGGIVTLSNSCFENQTTGYGKDELEFCSSFSIHKHIRVLNVLDPVKYTTISLGVVGFVNPIAERLSLPGKLHFASVVPSIEAVVDQYKHEIQFFIALGDGDMTTARNILDQIPEVKLVVLSGDYEAVIPPGSSYPVLYKHGYIASAGRFGSSVGNLVFDLDANNASFQLVPERSKLIETSRPEIWNAAAQAAQRDYTMLEAQIRRLKEDVVGKSRVRLQGGLACRRQECNLGNLVADAMVHCAIQRVSASSFRFPLHCVWHAGSIFQDDIPAGENISRFDIRKWLPSHNMAHLVRVKGRNLRRVLEAGANGMKATTTGSVPDWGQFLQLSNGLQVFYDSQQEKGKEDVVVSRIRITQDNNGIPQLGDLVEESDYYLVIPTLLYEGRSVFEFVRKEPGFWQDVILDNATSTAFAFDDECVEGYVKALGSISVGFEERIWVDEDPAAGGRSCNWAGHMATTVSVTVIIFGALQALVYVGYVFLIPKLRRRGFGESTTEYSRGEL